jgi:hypothetical protein
MAALGQSGRRISQIGTDMALGLTSSGRKRIQEGRARAIRFLQGLGVVPDAKVG